MPEVMANHSDSQHFESKNLKAIITNEKEGGIVRSCAPHSNGEWLEVKEPTDHVDIMETELLEKGYMQYGYGFCLFPSCSLPIFSLLLLIPYVSWTDVCIISEDAALERHAAMRFLTVAIVIMKLRQVTLVLSPSKVHSS